MREKDLMPVLEESDVEEGNVRPWQELSILKKTSLFHKDVKIKGHIGGVIQRDKISYVSPMYQISQLLNQFPGYEEEDVIKV